MSPALTKTPPLGKLGIPAGGTQEEIMSESSKVASPTDSDNAEKNLAALETKMNGKLSISTAATPVVPQEQPDFSSDPLSATALTSPLHSINWDQVRAGSLNSIANESFPTQWATSNNNCWEAFKRTGPRYPPSLEKLVMDYHHKHSKSWQLAHDMGAGSGVYSPTLARYFRHVHISDPTPTGLTNSRMAMTSWSAENKKSRGRFTFSVSKAEQGFEAVADRTVDMAIMTEGAHFTAPDSMVRSAGQMLSKDGTLALVTYSPICRINGNPAANDAVQRLFNAWGTQPWDVVCGEARGKRQFSTGLDFVALPDDVFDTSKTRRITINTTGKGSTAFQVPGVTVDASDSRVHNGERKHDYSSENSDEQARGWRQEVGPEFFRTMTAALVGQGAVQQFDEHFKEIQKIVHETSPNGLMITVEWTVAVLLATRR
jgi:hypothetical protein